MKNIFNMLLFSMFLLHGACSSTENVNEADKDWKPLYRAINVNDLEEVRKLIAAKANINEKNKFGGGALELAVINNKIDIVRLLVKAKANVNAKDNEGHTMLDYSADHPEITSLLKLAGAK